MPVVCLLVACRHETNVVIYDTQCGSVEQLPPIVCQSSDVAYDVVVGRHIEQHWLSIFDVDEIRLVFTDDKAVATVKSTCANTITTIVEAHSQAQRPKISVHTNATLPVTDSHYATSAIVKELSREYTDDSIVAPAKVAAAVKRSPTKESNNDIALERVMPKVAATKEPGIRAPLYARFQALVRSNIRTVN